MGKREGEKSVEKEDKRGEVESEEERRERGSWNTGPEQHHITKSSL